MRDIVRFYEDHDLTPRIYNSYQERELEILRPHLAAHGFIVSEHTDNEGDWTINVLKNHLHHEQFHLLGLYVQGKCRAMASVKFMDGYSRVDDVRTHAAFRGQHLGTKLMTYLLAYHAERSDNDVYLYAHNPIAIKLYENIGFQEFEIDWGHWSAYTPSLNSSLYRKP